MFGFWGSIYIRGSSLRRETESINASLDSITACDSSAEHWHTDGFRFSLQGLERFCVDVEG
jgi:hypothetical protein